MATIDEQTDGDAELAAERRRGGRVEFDNPHLVEILRQPGAPAPAGFDEALFGEVRRPAPRSRLLETVLTALAFWCLAAWLLLTCVG